MFSVVADGVVGSYIYLVAVCIFDTFCICFVLWHLVLLVHMCLQLKFGFLFASHYLHLFSVVAGGVVFSYVSLVDF